MTYADDDVILSQHNEKEWWNAESAKKWSNEPIIKWIETRRSCDNLALALTDITKMRGRLLKTIQERGFASRGPNEY